MKEEGSAQRLLNRFEISRNRVMQRGERSGSELGKNRKEILKGEKAKRRVEI